MHWRLLLALRGKRRSQIAPSRALERPRQAIRRERYGLERTCRVRELLRQLSRAHVARSLTAARRACRPPAAPHRREARHVTPRPAAAGDSLARGQARPSAARAGPRAAMVRPSRAQPARSPMRLREAGRQPPPAHLPASDAPSSLPAASQAALLESANRSNVRPLTLSRGVARCSKTSQTLSAGPSRYASELAGPGEGQRSQICPAGAAAARSAGSDLLADSRSVTRPSHRRWPAAESVRREGECWSGPRRAAASTKRGSVFAWRFGPCRGPARRIQGIEHRDVAASSASAAARRSGTRRAWAHARSRPGRREQALAHVADRA